MDSDSLKYVAGPITRTQPQLRLNSSPATHAALREITHAVTQSGGRAILVGGTVRDMVYDEMHGTSTPSKDVDIEVFGIPTSTLRSLLEALGPVDLTGEAFQVLKFSVAGEKNAIDISVPRRERAVGSGHRDFHVDADPHMTFSEAALRRDFTIGAMGYDLATGTLLDPHGGQADLARKTLQHVSDAFAEDPLRALRAARIGARFGLTVSPATTLLCRQLRRQAHQISHERIWSELSGMLLQASRPGDGLRILEDIEWLDVFPELAALRGIQQDPQWHPEGDALEHTIHVANYYGTNLRNGSDSDLVLGLAGLLHDLGKATTTEMVNGTWKAHGHEGAGGQLARKFLLRFGQVKLAERIEPYVKNHLSPLALHKNQQQNKDPHHMDHAVRRLSTRVESLETLAMLSESDAGGRPPLGPERGQAAREWLMRTAERIGVAERPPAALARGEHLIALGLKPGPQFAPLLAKAWDAQLAGEITNEQQAGEYLRDLLSGTMRDETMPVRRPVQTAKPARKPRNASDRTESRRRTGPRTGNGGGIDR